MPITKNEVKFICWGGLMTIYVVSLALMAIASRELVLAPTLGSHAAIYISMAIMLGALYMLTWHFMCRAHIPRRSWSLWITGLFWGGSLFWVESLSRQNDLTLINGTSNIMFLLILASLIAAPVILKIPANRMRSG